MRGEKSGGLGWWRLVLAGIVAATGLVSFMVARSEDGPRPPWQPVTLIASQSPPNDVDSKGLYDGRFSPTTSAAVAIGLANASLFAIFAVSLVRGLGRRRRAREALEPPTTGETIITGTVEPLEEDAGDTKWLVEVRILQQGSESTYRDNTSHAWSELRREVSIRPFGVRTAHDALIVVESGEAPIVDIPLDKIESEFTTDSDQRLIAQPQRRFRVGRLEPGTEVRVRGVLRGSESADRSAYRDRAQRRVVSSAPGGHLLISTRPIDHFERAEATRHFFWVKFSALVWTLCALVLAPGYGELLLDGESVVAPIDGKRSWQVAHRPKNGSMYFTEEYAVRGHTQLSNGRTVEVQGECDELFFGSVGTTRALVPAVVARHDPNIYALGAHAGLAIGRGIIVGVLVAFIWCAFFLAERWRTPPWQHGGILRDTGQGRLDPTTVSDD